MTAAEDLEQQVETLEAELTELRDEHDDVLRERDDLRKQVETLTERIDNARKDLDDVVRGLS